MTVWNKSLPAVSIAFALQFACGGGSSADNEPSDDTVTGHHDSSAEDNGLGTSGSSTSGQAVGEDDLVDDAIEAFPDHQVCEQPGLSSPVLRRLSHVEYRNTLRDLLHGIPFVTSSTPPVELLPDAAIYGFENNARALGASAVLVEQYASEAQKVAEKIATGEMANCTLEEDQCGLDFVGKFGAQAFRRPLSTQENQRFEAFFVQQRQALGLKAALALTAEALLQSPGFLYRIELPAENAEVASSIAEPYAMASRMSYLLWQTMPDQQLFDAAEAGQLSTPGQLAAQARRMLDDPKAATALVDFHRQWLGLGRVLGESKDTERFPLWQPETSQDALEESLRFVEYVYSEAHGSVQALLTLRVAFVNESLAALYGVDYNFDSGEVWQQVELPPERAGILTRAAFLAGFGHPATTSPPLRGVAVLDKFLCSRPPPAPASADTSTPVAEQGTVATTRQLFAQRTEPAQCQGCHLSINGIGMAFEQFDTIGRFRIEENGLPVDSSGELFVGEGAGVFDGIVELSDKLSQSQQVQACAVKNFYRSAFGQTEASEDQCQLEFLQQALAEHQGDLREVLVELVASAQFAGRARPLEAPAASSEEL